MIRVVFESVDRNDAPRWVHTSCRGKNTVLDEMHSEAGRFKYALWLKHARRLKHTWNWDHRSVINARSVKCMV